MQDIVVHDDGSGQEAASELEHDVGVAQLQQCDGCKGHAIDRHIENGQHEGSGDSRECSYSTECLECQCGALYFKYSEQIVDSS